MAKYLLDANVLVDWLKGKPEVVRVLGDLMRGRQLLALNAICVSEVYAGLAGDERGPADRIVGAMDYWDIGTATARLAGDYRYQFARKGRALSTPDALMAASAIANDAILVTGNVKDFPMPELKLLKLPE